VFGLTYQKGKKYRITREEEEEEERKRDKHALLFSRYLVKPDITA
jgi:hypothetical protein